MLLRSGSFIAVILASSFSVAQTPPDRALQGLGIPDRFGGKQELPEIPLTDPQETTPDLPLPPPPLPSKDRLSGKLRVDVKKIELTGNAAFSDAQLAPVVADYEGRVIDSEDLFTLRNALTRHYIDRGYINSGAIIPDQKVEDGVVEIQIVEGSLTDINVAGNDWLRDNYISKRLRIGNEDTLNINSLQDRIKLLHQDHLIDRINAELLPGEKPGEGVLNLRIEESRPYNLGVSFNNFRSPGVGELQGEMYGSLYNITGYGDALNVRYALTDGLDRGSASYSVPISSYDTRLRFHYSKSDADVVEKPFEFLDIQSESTSYGVTLTHPFYQTPQRQLVGTVVFEERKSKTTFRLPGSQRRPFAFSGVDNGRSKVTVLRFRQGWVDRSSTHVLALRSTISWGIDASKLLDQQGNTINNSEYFAWLGQFQWVQRLGNSDMQLLVRAHAQLTPDPLLPLERFSVGGARTVRGYRENQLVRDNGAVASAELRVPIFRLPIPYLSQTPADGIVQLAAFYDFGWSENTEDSVPPNTLSSAGIGVRWGPSRKIHGELYWGIPFRNVDVSEEHRLQDSGIHFLLNVDLL